MYCHYADDQRTEDPDPELVICPCCLMGFEELVDELCGECTIDVLIKELEDVCV